jgi:hypothetical protein
LESFERGRERRFQTGLERRPPRGSWQNVYDPTSGKNVRRFITPEQYGEDLESPLPAAMLQAGGMAQGARANINRMVELSDQVTAGPIIGHLSKLWQRTMGPSGDEGEFDFIGNALVDTVYIKSGKQINETEMRVLRQMIPDRARGNVPEQVRLFKRYAKVLLNKYGAYEGEFDEETPAPRGAGGRVPPPPGGPPPTGGGADPLEGRTATGPNGQKLVRRGGKWVPVQ